MYTSISDLQYDHVMNVIRGNEKLNPFFQELKDFIEQQHDIVIFDFYITNKNDKNYIVALTNKNWNYQRKAYFTTIQLINNRILELCIEYNFMPLVALESNIIFENFTSIYRGKCYKLASEKAVSFLTEKYSQYNISFVNYSGFGWLTVFYTNEKEEKNNLENGINNLIAEDFHIIMKEFDELKLIKNEDYIVGFDNKE